MAKATTATRIRMIIQFYESLTELKAEVKRLERLVGSGYGDEAARKKLSEGRARLAKFPPRQDFRAQIEQRIAALWPALEAEAVGTPADLIIFDANTMETRHMVTKLMCRLLGNDTEAGYKEAWDVEVDLLGKP